LAWLDGVSGGAGRDAVKVVLFCGGQGMRVRDHEGAVPKPMVNIGNRPILWHLMKYYAYFGHKEFILCLGYKADVIKDYFLNYKEWMSNDLVLRDGGRDIQLLSSDIDDWEITFADTGTQATIGERLLAVRSHVGDDEMFLANYADGLSDLWLPAQLDAFEASDAIGSFMVVHSPQSFHVARIDDDGMCAAIEPLADSAIWFNAGYFAFRRAIFDYIHPGDELVVEPFQRLIAERRLMGHRYDGFWQAMDTFKDLHALEARHQQGDAPWQVWRPQPQSATPAAS
jgi:glucose-1-phosphate cytidylyltransferase